MMNKSEMYQAGYSDYNNGECHFPEDQQYMDGWQNAQWDSESEYEHAMEAIFELKAELYENEHMYQEY